MDNGGEGGVRRGAGGPATCCCHRHRLYYIGMAANRCRYKRGAAVNKYDNGGRSERMGGVCGARYGIPVYKSDHQKRRPVSVRTSRMSRHARTHTRAHTYPQEIASRVRRADELFFSL